MAGRLPGDKNFPVSFYVDSFVAIIHCISDSLVQCDASTQIGELFCNEFDDVDFELALTCFEATHRNAFVETLWKVDPTEYEDTTIEEFIERYLDPAEHTDPLFVTKRFLMFQETLTKVLSEENFNPPGESA